MSAPTGVNVPHILFDPGPGTAQEVGVMLGFIATFVLSMSVYLLFWKRTSISLFSEASLQFYGLSQLRVLLADLGCMGSGE